MTSTVAAPSVTVRRARYSLIAANMDLRLSRRGLCLDHLHHPAAKLG
jgi:hypothetical protein